MCNEINTALFVTRALPSILTVKCTSFPWLREFRQTLYFALYSVLFTFYAFDIVKYSLSEGCFVLQGIEIHECREVWDRNVEELHNSAVFQAEICWPFICTTAWNKGITRLFLSKSFTKIWQHISWLLLIQTSIN